MKTLLKSNSTTSFVKKNSWLDATWPGMNPAGKIASLPQVRLDATREGLLDYFNNGWALTEILFSGLAREEAFYIRPYHKLRHPMIFYYTHPAVLYVNKLRLARLLEKPVNADFERLFEVGVDEMSWDDLHENDPHIWPSLDQARQYRAQVYKIVRTVIETHPLLASGHLPITPQNPMWALVMGFEHERIHLETSSVLLREMPLDYVREPEEWPASPQSGNNVSAANAMIALPETEVTLGKPENWPTFGWDNEYGNETRVVAPFSASTYLVSNGEYLEFVRHGGYTTRKYWSPEGWAWRSFRDTQWPAFWIKGGSANTHAYRLRTIFNVIDLPLNWPVCVNFHEAKAFCAWKSAREGTTYRLLSEAEHHALRDGKEHGFNFNLAQGSESPVDALTANDKGFHDVFGNVWQWCEDHFHPLMGATPHPLYADFSTPCYDGRHQMMLGGSFISSGDEASRWARFHFRPHFFQHVGFRLVESPHASQATYISVS